MHKMYQANFFKCIHCGKPTLELYKTYGPSVLKLIKCEKCNEIVDKYIEYDPVIVVIDLVLMSKEAQRHVLYNTEFKAYWKLLIVLLMLETYGLWRKDSLFNIFINSVCSIPSNNTISLEYLQSTYSIDLPQNISIPQFFTSRCNGWRNDEKSDESDLFLWEKVFYIHFTANLAGTTAFIAVLYGLMKLLSFWKTLNQVHPTQLLKAFSLANSSTLFLLPMLVWGSGQSVDTRLAHYSLVSSYTFVVFASVFSVLYECRLSTTCPVLLVSYIVKFFTALNVTPLLR